MSETPKKQSPNKSADPQFLPLSPLSGIEIERIALDLQALKGAQLQECVQTSTEFGLGFYHQGATLWLWFDLDPRRPLVVRWVGAKPPARKRVVRPMTLFLRSRFLGRRLKDVGADAKRGRILLLSFHRGADEDASLLCRIEVRLFPHGQNVIAEDGEKSISEYKPKDVPAHRLLDQSESARDWTEIESLWRSAIFPNEVARGPRPADAEDREWRKRIAKKQTAVERLREELALKTSGEEALVGEWLKTHGHLDVPSQWSGLIDRRKSLAWNIEECFRVAKEKVRKADGTRARLEAVTRELEKMNAAGPLRASATTVTEEKSLLSEAEARGRRMRVADDVEVYIGKSAGDNLRILRRAQPFDYWLHLRERPGSHAILRRTRHRQITDAEFAQAGRWVAEQSLKKRASELKGEGFDLLIVECRFVRPIKGDKLGRVNYTNDRVLRLKF